MELPSSFFFLDLLNDYLQSLQDKSMKTENPLMEIIVFLFTCILFIWPPDPLVQSGLTFENFFQPSSSVLSHPLICLELKVLSNRRGVSILPCLFAFYLVVNYGLTANLLYFSAITVLVFLYFEVPWLLRILRGSEFIARCGLSPSDLLKVDQMMYQGRFVAEQSYSSSIHLNSEFFVYERRFGFYIERISELSFTSIGTTFNAYSQPGEITEWLTIRAENLSSKASYTFRIRPHQLPILMIFVLVEVKHRGVAGRFIETFLAYIKRNAKFVMHGYEPSDPCFACNEKQPDVIIKKSCTGSECTECHCRPTWCSSCLARIFMAAQRENRPSTWMDGTVACPTCRAVFCANDVLFITDNSEE